MREAGVELLYSIDELAVMGFGEVLGKIPFFLKAMRNVVNEAKVRKPSLFVAVDFPGFNIRMCGRMRKLGVPVVYYISPQVWAWGEGRIEKIKKNVDRMLVIFPFEEEFYRKRGILAEYVGHPLVKKVKAGRSREEYLDEIGFDKTRPVIGLFPGSRLQEVRRILPEMLGAAEILSERGAVSQFLLGPGVSLEEKEMKKLLGNLSARVKVDKDRTYDLMSASDLILVTSGTATLEAALLEKPMVILYKTSTLSWLIGRAVVKLPYIGLANIVAGAKVVPELLQDRCRRDVIADTAEELLRNGDGKAAIKKAFSTLRSTLGERDAPATAAEATLSLLREIRH